MGNTKTEAVRTLRRRIPDEVYRRLVTDHSARAVQDRAPVSAAA
jgi:hypothetical protein